MARINAVLDRLERPEDILRALEKEMAQKLRDVADAEAKALSAVKGAQRRHDEAGGRILRYRRGAELALQAGDEETARQALAAQVDTERTMQQLDDALAQAQKAYQQARQTREQLQHTSDQLKQRCRELQRRDQANQATKAMLEKNKPHDLAINGSILEAVARLEMKIETDEAEIEVQNQLQQTLGLAFDAERVRKLERDVEIERRLNQLRRNDNESSRES